jgi:oxygen-independent coproporphyrinogen-3 oxidase
MINPCTFNPLDTSPGAAPVADPRSLYIHIPFCPAKCPYCAFVTHIGSLKLVEPYLQALVLEAEHAAAGRPCLPLETVYLGGGTPSVLTPRQFDRLITEIRRIFGVSPGAEITLEAHPDTVDHEKLAGFREAGATRISFGGESLRPNELLSLGRTHLRSRVLDAVREARAEGFDDINVDLMYGVPEQTLASWDQTLAEVLDAAPDHLSLYPLSIEPRTVFARLRNRNQLELPADEIVAEMYSLACRRLSAAGYGHYEIANWARPGRQSRHNLAYWRNLDFHAIGVGAHGYLRPYRFENLTQTGRYIETVLAGGSPRQVEIHTDATLEASDTIMLGLRLLQEGLDTRDIQRRYGINLHDRFAADIETLTAANLMRLDDGRLYLSEAAVPVANEIWARFLL